MPDLEDLIVVFLPFFVVMTGIAVGVHYAALEEEK